MDYVHEILEAIEKYKGSYTPSLVVSKKDNSIKENVMFGGNRFPTYKLFNFRFEFLDENSVDDWKIVFSHEKTSLRNFSLTSTNYREMAYSVRKNVPEDPRPIDYEKISELI